MRTDTLGFPERADRPAVTVAVCNKLRRAHEYLRGAAAQMAPKEADAQGLFLLMFYAEIEIFERQARIARRCEPWFDTTALERSPA